MTFYKLNEVDFRTDIIDELGNSLQKFKSNEDRIKIVDKFLDSESEPYVVNLSKLAQNNESIIDALYKCN